MSFVYQLLPDSKLMKKRRGVSSSNVCYDADHEMLETTDGSSSEFESDFSTSEDETNSSDSDFKLYDMYILFGKTHKN